MFLASVNLVLCHLLYTRIPDMPCSRQHGNMPEMPSLGLWPPSASIFLEGVLLPEGVLFKHKSSNPESTPQPPSLLGSPVPSHCTSDCLHHPRTRYQMLGTSTRSHSLLKWFTLANPKPANPTSFLPADATIKAFAHCFPHPTSWPTPMLPHVSHTHTHTHTCHVIN